MQNRVSLITLGVNDIAKSTAFYEAMGWKQAENTDEGIVVFDLIGQVLGLYPLVALAEDIGLPMSELGAGRSTLGYNTQTKDEVALLMDKAKAAGAKILKPAQDVFWGGHHGYFADLDGHIWEIAHNPFSALGPKGEFQWGGV